jgi:hypothetical protein
MVYAHVPHQQWTGVWLILDWVLKVVISLVVSELLLRGAVPVLRYSAHGSSLRELGLHLVFTDEKAYCRIVSRLVSEHPKHERVRVICISGKYLFAEPKTPSNEPTPLYDHAQSGLLDVLMPVNDPKNPTIRARFDTYNEEFKRQHHYEKVKDLVEEVAMSKNKLSDHKRNRVTEHTILCLWRVVILQKHCIVQTYFPNPRGVGSNEAPIFVFQRHPTNENFGYYGTFANMFDLVGRYASPTAPHSPSA